MCNHALVSWHRNTTCRTFLLSAVRHSDKSLKEKPLSKVDTINSVGRINEHCNGRVIEEVEEYEDKKALELQCCTDIIELQSLLAS